MSEFIQRNKLMIHIAAEITFGCLLILYVLRSNKGLYSRIIYLEDKLSQFEKTLQEQDQLIQSLLRTKKMNTSLPPPSSPSSYPTPTHPTSLPTLSAVSSPSSTPPAPVVKSKRLKPSQKYTSAHAPPPSRPRYQPTLDTIYEEEVEDLDHNVDVIETEQVYEENMDEEIENELQKLNLKK